MSLADQIESDVLGVFLDAGDFAQLVTYFPAGGGAPRPVLVVDSQTTKREDEQSHHSNEMESVALSASRDPVQGIDNPQRGDSILFADDPPARRWSFKEIVDQDSAMVQVRFERPRVLKAGQIRPAQL